MELLDDQRLAEQRGAVEFGRIREAILRENTTAKTRMAGLLVDVQKANKDELKDLTDKMSTCADVALQTKVSLDNRVALLQKDYETNDKAIKEGRTHM
jgi:hypothetical protein